jgi:hypothetical protein
MVVLARGLGKCVLTGAPISLLDRHSGRARVGNTDIRDGDILTIDGTNRIIYGGAGTISSGEDYASDAIRAWATVPEVPVMLNVDLAGQVPASGLAEGVGLCRSERHLRSDLEVKAIADILDGDNSRSTNDVISSALGARLEEILVRLDGMPIHYRLLDPGDFFHDARQRSSFRGIRWGILSGFYEKQLRMVSGVITRVASGLHSIDIVIVAPFVSLPEEARWLKSRVQALQYDSLGQNVRVRSGAMIETPLGVVNAMGIAKAVEMICIGTNDLTEQVWGLDRTSGSEILAKYQTLGLAKLNPFERITMSGIGTLIRQIQDQIRRVSPGQRAVMCGEQASIPQNGEVWTDIGRPILSVRPSALTSVRVALFQNLHSRRTSLVKAKKWGESTRWVHSTSALTEIQMLIRGGQVEAAQKRAWTWAVEVATLLNFGQSRNWKFFKRDLAAHWFGSNPCRRFPPGWSPERVLEYAESLRSEPAGVRFSVFPETIACHAVSNILPAEGSHSAWAELIAKLDRDSSLEVFPQQRSDRMCFRIVVQQQRISLEAGIGQAMYVFEQERGHHQVMDFEVYPSSESTDLVSNSKLAQYVALFKREGLPLLAAKLLAMQDTLGIEWLGLEGYYSPVQPLFVCDVDLPADLAFHASNQRR